MPDAPPKDPDVPPKPDGAALAKEIDDLPADKEAVKQISKALDEAEDITEVAQAASRKLEKIGDGADDLKKLADPDHLPPNGNGRKAPTIEPNKTQWDEQAKVLREAREEVADLRVQVNNKLANTDGMTPDEIDELVKLKEKLDDNLLKLYDIDPAHGPVNHVYVTDEGLMDRVGRNINPQYKEAQASSPAKATRFKDKSDFLDAAEVARFSPDDVAKAHPTVQSSYADALDLDPDMQIFSAKIPLEDLLGSGYADKLDGFWRVGSQSGDLRASKLPSGAFDGQTGTAVYKKVDGEWELYSLYPNTKGHNVMPRPTNDDPAEMIYDAVTGTWIST